VPFRAVLLLPGLANRAGMSYNVLLPAFTGWHILPEVAAGIQAATAPEPAAKE
jgi:hypothetical protein